MPLSEHVTQTLEGIDIKPLYTEQDIAHLSHLNSMPGAAPTRTTRDHVYTDHGLSDNMQVSQPLETNAFFKSALAAGQKGLSVAFDLATHRGYDSDHPRVEGDVGKAGGH